MNEYTIKEGRIVLTKVIGEMVHLRTQKLENYLPHFALVITMELIMFLMKCL